MLTCYRLKDCDVTWLYGPLQTGSQRQFQVPGSSPSGSSRVSKSPSFIQKKPILKKRSMSEIMLQKSLSASSLLKQAAAAVQAQQHTSERPGVLRATSDFVTFPFSSRRSRENTSVLPSVSSSGICSPAYEKKHIHFNEQVEQCIALEVKGDDDEEVDSYAIDDDSDSDDDGIMMKRTNSKRTLPLMSSKKTTPRNNSFSNDTQTIAMLPSTTLKYREDTPEPPETAMKHSNAFWKLSPSPSQETLRPSKPSGNFLLGNDDDDDEDEDDIDWQPPNTLASRKDSISVAQDRLQGFHVSGGSSSEEGQPSGMRRTPSGMFMPVEEDEDTGASEGLLGKVVDTVNTAKDIAHVIWNVGWRR
jgi:hypothetical protein